MMDLLDIVTKLIDIFNVKRVFGIGIEGSLILLIGSLLVGYICLTFYYRIYYDNEKWTKLDYFEKAIVSLVIGFLSILVSIYAVTIYQFTFPKDDINLEQLDQFFLQLKYIAPFLYFIGFSAITAKYNYIEFDFIKKYISISFGLIVSLNFAFALIIFYLVRSWSGFLWVVSLILMYVILYKYRELKEYLARLSAKIKTRS